MEFHDKLIFLMNITQTSNKELAHPLSVDPSLISLFRSGKCNPARNEASPSFDHSRMMIQKLIKDLS